MNLFWICEGDTPSAAAAATAAALCQQHVFKVHVLELLQVLSTAIRWYADFFKATDKFPNLDELFKSTHPKHPLVLWACEHPRNVHVMILFVRAALMECAARGMRTHVTRRVYEVIRVNQYMPNIRRLCSGAQLPTHEFQHRSTNGPAWCGTPPPICVNDPRLSRATDARIVAAYAAAQRRAAVGDLVSAYRFYMIAKIGLFISTSRQPIFRTNDTRTFLDDMFIMSPYGSKRLRCQRWKEVQHVFIKTECI